MRPTGHQQATREQKRNRVIPRSMDDTAQEGSSPMQCQNRDVNVLNLRQIAKYVANSDQPDGQFVNNDHKENYKPGLPQGISSNNTVVRAESGVSGCSAESALEFGVVPIQSRSSGLLFALRKAPSSDVTVPEETGHVTNSRQMIDEESSSSAGLIYGRGVRGGLGPLDSVRPDRSSSSNCFSEEPLRLVRKTRDHSGSPIDLKLNRFWMSQAEGIAMPQSVSGANRQDDRYLSDLTLHTSHTLANE